MWLVGHLGRITRLSALQQKSGDEWTCQTPPEPRWSVTFAHGRGSTRAFHDLQLAGVDEGPQRAGI